MTLSDRQGHSPIVSFSQMGFFVRYFSYGCAAGDKISTDSASRGPSAIAELVL